MARGVIAALRYRAKTSKSTAKFLESFLKSSCFYCGCQTVIPKRGDDVFIKNKLTADHIILRSNGGTLERRNLIPCCELCNNMRGDKDFIAFGIESIVKHNLKLV